MKKNIRYILSLHLIVIIISYFISSCSSFLNNDLSLDDLNGKVFKSEDESKIIFKNDRIYFYAADGEDYIFTSYNVEISNMISIIFEDNQFRIYLLEDDSIYFTLDKEFYYAK